MSLDVALGDQIADRAAQRAAAHPVVAAERLLGRQLEPRGPAPGAQVQEEVFLDLMMESNRGLRLERFQVIRRAGRRGLARGSRRGGGPVGHGAHPAICIDIRTTCQRAGSSGSINIRRFARARLNRAMTVAGGTSSSAATSS